MSPRPQWRGLLLHGNAAPSPEGLYREGQSRWKSRGFCLTPGGLVRNIENNLLETGSITAKHLLPSTQYSIAPVGFCGAVRPWMRCAGTSALSAPVRPGPGASVAPNKANLCGRGRPRSRILDFRRESGDRYDPLRGILRLRSAQARQTADQPPFSPCHHSCKTNPIVPIFGLITGIGRKNKANQSQLPPRR